MTLPRPIMDLQEQSHSSLYHETDYSYSRLLQLSCRRSNFMAVSGGIYAAAEFFICTQSFDRTRCGYILMLHTSHIIHDNILEFSIVSHDT